MEFGFVVLPFMMMIFGVINAATYFFTVNSLDRGVEDATRQIRTGEIRFTVNSDGTTGMEIGTFQTAVCTAAKNGGAVIDCSKLQILVNNNGQSWTNMPVQSCQTAGNLTPSTGASKDQLSTYTGAGDTVVVISACYLWDLPQYLPFLKLSNYGNSLLIQSSTAFRTEPY